MLYSVGLFFCPFALKAERVRCFVGTKVLQNKLKKLIYLNLEDKMIKINKNNIHITVIDLAEEYKNNDIPVRWAIVSNLSEKEIKDIFRNEIESYYPFIILNNEMGDAIISYHKNNEKFRWRYLERETIGLSEDIISANVDNSCCENSCDNTMLRIINKEILNKALKSLTKKQRKRIILHYSGMTEREIAKIEKVDQKTIHESIDKAKKHLKNAKLKN